MTKVRFLFYKSDKDGKVIDDVISVYTSLLPINWFVPKQFKQYSHMEAWFPDQFGQFESALDGAFLGDCISSTSRGSSVGVRAEPAEKTLNHPNRWDYFEFEVEDTALMVVKTKAYQEIGKFYDWLGVFGFSVPVGIEDPSKWYCSEYGMWIVWLFKLIAKRLKIVSPLRAAYILWKKCGKLPKHLV